MIENVIQDYLIECFPDYPVLTEEPLENNADRCILIEKTGGSVNNRIYSSTFVIETFAESMFYAAQMNEQLKDYMEDIVQLDAICSCKLNTDYNYTDTNTKRYRYQAMFDIVHY